MPAPVGTAGNVASRCTFRSVPFGENVFAGPTQAAVSITAAPTPDLVIFRSSHVCSWIRVCAIEPETKSTKIDQTTTQQKRGITLFLLYARHTSARKSVSQILGEGQYRRVRSGLSYLQDRNPHR